MFHLSRPGAERVRRYLDEQRRLPCSYDAIGATNRGEAPPGFSHDHNRQLLGTGEATFAAAREAIRAWRMFPAPWTAVEPLAPIEKNEVVAVHMRTFGLWWLNAARIVYVIDEPRRFGFAYGTLPGHVERGEERFLIEWRDDDSVWFDLEAFSRPRYWMVWLVYPVARALQRRFVRDSKATMARATGI